MLKYFSSYLLLVLTFSVLHGQEAGQGTVELPKLSSSQSVVEESEGSVVEAVSEHEPSAASSQVIVELHKQIQQLRTELAEEDTPDHLQNLEKLSELEGEFEKSVVGEDVVQLYSEEEEQSSLEEEFMNILQPIFGAVKETTASLRAKEDLRLAIEEAQAQEAGASKAVEIISLYAAEESVQSPDLQKKLEDLKARYSSRAKLAEAKKETLTQTLEALKLEDENAVGKASEKFATFVKSTGLHLLIGLLVFTIVFFGTNYAFRKLLAYSEKNAHKLKRFNYEYLATIDGTVFLGSLILACLLVPVVFLLFSNWLLISIYMLVLLVLFWMVKDKIPDLLEEVRLILNIGAVREQERIIYNGLPWNVDEIKFYSRLVNPNLEGGRLRIPLGDLVGMHSRVYKKDEPYFPTNQGDWILVGDEIVGEITRQTVEHVTIKEVGGSIRTIQTPAFLEMNPVNLSANGFRTSILFGIDYKHQKEAVTEIEQQMSVYIKNELLEELDDPSYLKDFFIEFAEAGSSSLDYEINAEFTGEVAPLYKEISCFLQRFALNACNHYGWEIPFTQIRIHQ